MPEYIDDHSIAPRFTRFEKSFLRLGVNLTNTPATNRPDHSDRMNDFRLFGGGMCRETVEIAHTMRQSVAYASGWISLFLRTFFKNSKNSNL